MRPFETINTHKIKTADLNLTQAELLQAEA